MAGGGSGVRMQPSQEADFGFRVYVAPEAGAIPLPLAEDVVIPVVGGAVDKFSLIAPSSVDGGSEMRLTVRVEDRFGNQASGYSGTLVLRDESGTVVARTVVEPHDGGLAFFDIEAPREPGVVRYTVDDGSWNARSNPVRIREGDDRPHLLFGDIHGHTLRSDGRGTPEQFHAYCRDVAALSFCALTEHDFMLSDASWEEIQTVVEGFNEPGRYATIHAFEWSGLSELGGDHNVYFKGNDTTLLRSRSYYDYRNQQTYHGPAPQVNFIEDLYSALLRDYPLGEVMTIPHYGGRPANPNWHEPRFERLIEIMSDHQRSHEWAYEFLRKGYRLGFMASSDNHTGRPGYGFLQNPLLSAAGTETGTSLVAVYAEELTRESVFDALYDRYA